MSHLAVVASAALLVTASMASATPTDGWQIRGIEKGAIEVKALDLRIMVPHTAAHFTLRKPLTRTRILYCGILRPKANPLIDVYFTSVVELTKVESFDVDSGELGKVYEYCRSIDMSMP